MRAREKNFAILVILVTLVFGVSGFLAGMVVCLFAAHLFGIYPEKIYIFVSAIVGGIVFAALGLMAWHWLWRKINLEVQLAFSIILVCLAFGAIRLFFDAIS